MVTDEFGHKEVFSQEELKIFTQIYFPVDLETYKSNQTVCVAKGEE